MKILVQYQIEVAICMAAFALIYLLLWRKETNFNFKRILLLGIPLFSIVIPLININIDLKAEQESAPIQYITYLPNQLEMVYAPIVAKTDTISSWDIAFWILAIGALTMFIRLLLSYIRIMQIYRKSSLGSSGQFRVVEDPIQSFSFFNMIMINRSQAQSNERDYIIKHELAHQRQGHSWDIFWLEIIKMLHWFNPVLWFITRESKKNLEYLADQEVARATGNPQNYQYAIVQHASQTGYQLLKTQFSKTNLKNRIIMMNQPNNQKIKAWKILAILPVLAILFMSFSLKIENLDIKKELSEVIPSFENFEIIDKEIHEDTKPEKFANTNIFKNNLQTVSIDTNDARDAFRLNPFDGKDFMENRPNANSFHNSQLFNSSNSFNSNKLPKLSLSISLKDKENINGVISNKSLNVLKVDHSTGAFTTDSIQMEVFTIVENQPYPSTGDMESYFDEINNNLIYPKEAKEKGIDGKVFVQFVVKSDGSLTDLKAVKGLGYGCDEEAIRAIKEGPGWVAGRQRGRAVNVRMIIPVTFIDANKIMGRVTSEDNIGIKGANVVIKGTTTGTVTDSQGLFMLQVKPEHNQIVVSSIGYLKETIDIAGGEKYEIALERDPEVPLPSQKSVGQNPGISLRADGKSLFDSDKKPLFILDGKEIENINSIDPSDIESISVLKDTSAVKIYGEKAKDGVVIIHSAKDESFIRNKLGDQAENLLPAETEKSFDKDNPPLVIVDGEEIPYSELNSIDHTAIASIEVLKKPISTREYGEKAKYGVIKITMKNYRGSIEDDINLPNYPGGMDAFYKFISKSIKYPKEARIENIQGQVKVSFTVTKDGDIKDINADKTEYIMLKEIVVVGYRSNQNEETAINEDLSVLEDEIERVLKQLETFKPGTKDGKPVDVRMTLPVIFKLG